MNEIKASALWHGKGLAALLAWLLLLASWLGVAGCGKDSDNKGVNAGLATQGGSPEAAKSYSEPDLAHLTRELRRWIVKTKQQPASFEDFAAKAQLTVPPAPAGKKFAISKEMRVVLVDR